MAGSQKRIRGTREWAVANIDCCTGCHHGCKYCYARYAAVLRDKSVHSEEWEIPRVRKEDVTKKQPLYSGTVMFPTTHDIHPEILTDCITVIENLLQAGNHVLIVTKPHLACIEELCRVFPQAKEQLLFRFTITAQDNEILSFWEPDAPLFEERFAALKHCHGAGFATSISIEPMLEGENIVELVNTLAPYVSHSIWIGRMNKIEKRVTIDTEEMEKEVARIHRTQSNEQIELIYAKLHQNPLVRWKDSIKEVVGIAPASEAGLDV